MNTISGANLYYDRLGAGTTNRTSEPNTYIAVGSQIPAGRFVVQSPMTNRAIAAGQNSSHIMTANLPIDGGINLVTADGTSYEDAGLVDDMMRNGVWIVVGVTRTAGACHDRCIQTQGWPFTSTLTGEEQNYYAVGAPLDLINGGEVVVQVGEDLTQTDPVTVFTAYPADAGDPMVPGSVGIGGSIVLPNCKYMHDAKAGGKVKIRIEGIPNA